MKKPQKIFYFLETAIINSTILWNVKNIFVKWGARGDILRAAVGTGSRVQIWKQLVFVMRIRFNQNEYLKVAKTRQRNACQYDNSDSKPNTALWTRAFGPQFRETGSRRKADNDPFCTKCYSWFFFVNHVVLYFSSRGGWF